MKKCDVIIPIYNAYDCLSPCIDSVIKNTDLKNNRIILIDDKSPDEKVLPLLEKYASKNESIVLLKNDENLGFVGTVNKGMKYSKNDVVLLNSDTEVTKDWLKHIQEKAYSEPKIGSVTPLSNNATLVSVPNGLQVNQKPDNISLEEYADMVYKTAYNEIVDLPTAHGFCMFIKREVLDIVGFFDEETFGKGYGEENDFSFRSLDYGYRNVLCDNTYILHKESQSFSEKKQKLIEEHSKILSDRYPVYNTRIGLWCQNFPIKNVCENILYEQEMLNRKNILMVIHDWSDLDNNIGGTTLHLKDLIMNMRDKFNFHVLFPENGIYKVTSYFKDKEATLKFNSIDSANVIPLYNSEYRKMVEKIIKGLRIDTLHIHHLIGHCMDIVDVAKENNVYSIITLHDLYSLCPTINMLYKMEEYCEPIENKDCKSCLKYKTAFNNDIIKTWQNDWNEFLLKFDKVIVPSKNTKEIISKHFKDIKIAAIEHGVDIERKTHESRENRPFNIAFVGVMAKHKGALILEELSKSNKNSNVVYHLFGKSEYKSLEVSKNNYIYHGKYNRSDIVDLLHDNKIDLVCSFSIWPETYSYTLTECVAAGIPVLTFDIGAGKDRILENDMGYVIPYTKDVSVIQNKIESIIKDEKEYNKIIENISNYKIKTIDQMIKEYIKIYNNTKEKSLSEESTFELKKMFKDNYKVNDSVSSKEAQLIMNSLRWKIVSKIDLPKGVKNLIRKIIKK